jgi:hypothetical protein
MLRRVRGEWQNGIGIKKDKQTWQRVGKGKNEEQ